jgi:hypothetical protein
MESKKRMMTGSKMARESRGPFISDGRMASSADRESMKQKLPFISDGRMACNSVLAAYCSARAPRRDERGPQSCEEFTSPDGTPCEKADG